MPTSESISQPFSRVRLIFGILAGVVFFTTVLIASAQIRDGYASLMETEKRAARNLVRSGESQGTQIFNEARRIVQGVGNLFADRMRASNFDETFFHDLLESSVESSDYLYSAYLTDQDGFALAASNTFPLDEGSRSVSMVRTLNIAVERSDFHLGRFSQASRRSGASIGGRWFIPAIYPVLDEADDICGYIIALVDPSVFAAFYSTMEVGVHGTVHLWDQNGVMVAANKNSPWKTGDQVPEVLGWMNDFADLNTKDASQIFVAERDGVPMVSTQLGVEDLSFGLAVTLDGRDFLEPWRQARQQVILEAVVFLTVLSALAFVLLRQLRQLEAGERSIRLAKNEAERANKVKVQFLAQVSHEFRTPLNAIIGFSQAIRDRVLGVTLDHKYTEYADDIYTSGRHLLELVNDIIDFSKIEAGEYKVKRTHVGVNSSVEEVLAMMSGQAQSRRINLSMQSEESDFELETDQRLLKQVLINLVANAIKFSDTGSRVTVLIDRAEDGGVVITVSDQGRGMSESILSRIGEPFLAESSQTNAEGQGSGLGLSIAKMCMDLMGGTLCIASKDDVGTDASMVFPVTIMLKPPVTE